MGIDKFIHIFYGFNLGSSALSREIYEKFEERVAADGDKVSELVYGCNMSGDDIGYALMMRDVRWCITDDESFTKCLRLTGMIGHGEPNAGPKLSVTQQQVDIFLHEIRSMGYDFGVAPGWHIAGMVS